MISALARPAVPHCTPGQPLLFSRLQPGPCAPARWWCMDRIGGRCACLSVCQWTLVVGGGACAVRTCRLRLRLWSSPPLSFVSAPFAGTPAASCVCVSACFRLRVLVRRGLERWFSGFRMTLDGGSLVDGDSHRMYTCAVRPCCTGLRSGCLHHVANGTHACMYLPISMVGCYLPISMQHSLGVVRHPFVLYRL